MLVVRRGCGLPRVGHEILSFPINIIEGCVFGGPNMKDLGTRIYWFGCVVAATVLGIGVADYWFGCIPLLGGIGGHSLASRPRIFVRSGSLPECASGETRGRGGLGSIIRSTAYLKMTLPPNRPLGQTLLLSAVVMGTAALGAVVLFAITSWLWLVVHQGLH